MEQRAEISREVPEKTAKGVGRNPFVFIVGCPRSGTTLLQRMIDAHPEVAIIYETHWIAKWYERRKGVTPEGMVTARTKAAGGLGVMNPVVFIVGCQEVDTTL